jgi:hypothetical protein
MTPATLALMTRGGAAGLADQDISYEFRHGSSGLKGMEANVKGQESVPSLALANPIFPAEQEILRKRPRKSPRGAARNARVRLSVNVRGPESSRGPAARFWSKVV